MMRRNRVISSPNSASRARTASVRASRVSSAVIEIDPSGPNGRLRRGVGALGGRSCAGRVILVPSFRRAAAMPSAVETVARSASLAATRSLVVMRVSGMFGRKTIAMRLTTARGTAMRNECAMAWA